MNEIVLERSFKENSLFLDLTALLAVLTIVIIYVTSKESGLGESMEISIVMDSLFETPVSDLISMLFYILFYVFRWMLASLRIAKVAFSYKREYKAELEEAMEKYIEELSEMEEDETW